MALLARPASAPTPDPAFVAALARYDALLRVRWAPRLAVWFIERKLPERSRQRLVERPNPFKSARGQDLYESWKEGYVHVLSVPPDMLDQRVFDALAEADTWRQGGFDAINRQLDEAEAQREATVDREIATWSEGAASDAYDRLAWLDGRRVALTEEGSGVIPSDRVEQHEGFTVRIRKGHHQEEVLA